MNLTKLTAFPVSLARLLQYALFAVVFRLGSYSKVLTSEIIQTLGTYLFFFLKLVDLLAVERYDQQLFVQFRTNDFLP